MMKMLRFEFSLIACLLFFAIVISARIENYCQEKEKSLLSLEIAEELISKVKDHFPNCFGVGTNTSECGEKEKATAYLDMMKKLISEARENYPKCIEPNIEEPVTNSPEPKEPVTEEPETKEHIEYPRDCSEVMQNGQDMSGVYNIFPNSSLLSNRGLQVFCDMDTDGGGWTVVQRRGNFKPQEGFYRDWNGYKYGFGNITKDFWLGNNNLFILSNQREYKIRFDLESVEGEKAYAIYDTFYIDNEYSRYKLHIGGYSGNAGDSLSSHNERSFFTQERDNAYTCATIRKGGWWYDTCGDCQLNSLYKPGARGSTYDYIAWFYWKQEWVGLAATEMKIKPIGD